MKLAPYIEHIERAYQSLIFDTSLPKYQDIPSFNYTPRRPAHILPCERQHRTPPHLAPNFNPTTSNIPFSNKERLVLLAAFEASYQDTITLLTPDMVPIIIDLGASVSISPYSMDFVGPIHPVQNINLQGIASGLQVAGIGTIQYKFRNDADKEQTLLVQRCLHVPQRSVRLLCPQQIGVMTGFPNDGFHATSAKPTLIVPASHCYLYG
jgi:hypothetical protein